MRWERNKLDDLWIRGGFPGSFLASSPEDCISWRDNFIRAFLDQDIPQLLSRMFCNGSSAIVDGTWDIHFLSPLYKYLCGWDFQAQNGNWRLSLRAPNPLGDQPSITI